MKCSILIAGIGGQGVITLGKILAVAGKMSGFEVTGCENKGGAQRGGKASSLVRLYSEKTSSILSTRIIDGAIDIVLSTDLYETARYVPLYNNGTCIISDKRAEIPALYRGVESEAYSTSKLILKLSSKFPNTFFEEFSQRALELTGSSINANVLLLAETIKKDILPLDTYCVFNAVSRVLGEESACLVSNYKQLDIDRNNT